MSALMIGHDAEVFVTKHGTIADAIGLLGGTKEDPLQVDQGALQEDNVLAELNIWPASNADDFVSRTNSVMSTLKQRLPSGYDVAIQSSHHYDKEYLIAAPEQAMEFGCDPDFNCWTLEENDTSSPLTTLRTAGGHVHIGFPHDVTEVTRVKTMRMCDYLLGLPSVLLDVDTERRSLYGSSGAYRPKPYGAEYRVLSNFWLKDETLMRWVFSQAVDCFNNRNDLDNYTGVLSSMELQHIINVSDVSAAAHWVRELNIQMPV
jgi:hypothetical protein